MLLQQAWDIAKLIAENDIPDVLFLRAARYAVDQIEAYEERLTKASFVLQPVDGSAVYMLPSGVTEENIFKVFFITALKNPVLLIRQYDLQPPQPNPDPATTFDTHRITYYDFPSQSTIQVDGFPLQGNLKYYLRNYANLTMATDVSYEPLIMGALVWMGKNIWQDARLADWQKTYETELKAETYKFLVQDSNLGNIGDRP